MNQSKAFRVFINIVAIINSPPFLLAWIALLVINHYNHDFFTGHLILAALWVIDLVIIGDMSDSPRITRWLLIFFPTFFTYVPIKICQFVYRLRSRHHVDQ